MIQLKRILCPTDFSEISAPAREYATALAGQYGAELHVLHVLDSMPPAFPEYPGSFWADTLRQAEQEARDRIAREMESGDGLKPSVKSVVRQGTAYVEIIRYAREMDIDLIVISTHGRTGLPHALLGSVAERVVRTAPCPVLTVRPSGHQFVMP